jgi:RNA polymerase sigma-70 factor (ECF subfamily)
MNLNPDFISLLTLRADMKDDLTLLKALSEGDQNALSVLYDKYSGALFGVIIRICRINHLAEDVLQETFIKIWENAGSYDPDKGRFYTWAYRIARNTSLNALRDRGYLIQSEDLSVYKEKVDEEEDVPFDYARLDGSMSKLEKHHQKALELVYFQGLSHREAHKVMKVPLGTFKSYIRQALRDLRLGLEDTRTLLTILISMVL